MKTKPRKTYWLVQVRWKDIQGDAGWAEHLDVYPCRTVGYLMSQNQHKILVADTLGEDGEEKAGLSANAPGLVTDVYVRVGDQVLTGDAMVQLDTADLVFGVERARQRNPSP